MHHRGDSVSEGGSQAGERKRREIVSTHWREDKRRQEGREDASLKLGQLHFQRLLNEIKHVSLSNV